jgi:uncharacterized membrane protein
MAEPDFYDDRPEAGDVIDVRPEFMVWSEGQWRELRAVDMVASRTSQEYRLARAEFRAACEKVQEPCWLCHAPIDYRLVYPHPDSWSLEHKKTVKEHPELFMDRENWAAAHLDCNTRRGTDEPHLDLGIPSRVW